MNRRGRPPYPDILTPREWEVLEFLRQGLSNEQIAERLGITLRTAKFHVSEILSKLGVESREQAAAWQPEEAPAPARRWLAWPLIARIASALVVVATVAGLGLLAWGVLRTSSGSEEPLRSDAEGLVQAALEKMESLDSYQVDIVDPELDGTATVVVVRSGLIAVRTTEITSAVLGSVSADETIYGANAQYDRLCQDYPVACGPWIENPRPNLISIGGTVIQPDWPLMALERAQDLRVLPQDTEKPDVVEVAGVFNWADVDAATIGRHLDPEVAASLIALRQANRPGEPAAIHAWISRQDASLQRILIELPEGTIPSSKTLGFYYSRFNEVSISAPTDFVPYTTRTPTP